MQRNFSFGTLVLVATLAVVPMWDAFAQRGGGRGGGGGGRSGGGGPSAGNRGGSPQPAANRGPAMVSPQARGPAGPSRPAGSSGGKLDGAARPATPNAGPQRPGQGAVGGQPGAVRPGTTPSTPNRPNVGGPQSAGQARPANGIGKQPSSSMNDFFGGNAGGLGGASSRPGVANSQGGGRLPGMAQGGDNRPGIGNNNRPGLGNDNRTNLGDRNTNIGDRKTNIGDRNTNIGDRNTNVGDRKTNVGDRNTNIGDRNNTNVNVGDRTNKGGNTVVNTGDINIGNKTNYNDNRQQWVDNRHNNGNVVRNNAGNRYWAGYNNPGWHAAGGYAYWGGWGAPGYGWQAATWATMGAFVGASLASQPQPVYYAYGTGGNVYYENNTVYVNGEAAGTPAQYNQQAQAMVQAAPPVDQPQEWMPLGVFALSREGLSDTQAVIELAISKTGAIAGTYHNEASGVSRPIKGTANLEQQRAAIGFADGKNAEIALETGIYNLTQDEAPGLLHTGAEQSEPVLLVRLQQPAGQ